MNPSHDVTRKEGRSCVHQTLFYLIDLLIAGRHSPFRVIVTSLEADELQWLPF